MGLCPAPANPIWSIVLSGGDGKRTRPFIIRWLGVPKPKQYCVFSGRASLFQRTLDRTEHLAPPARRVTVAAAWHRTEVASQMAGRDPGRVVFQPGNHGTAPGIFLPSAHVKKADPGATVVVFPSDHFVHPETAFVEAVRNAVHAVDRVPEKMVLLGAIPDRAECDYGWIEPGSPGPWEARWGLRPVHRFVEKPGPERAREVLDRGGLWNTFVLVAKLETLWEVGRECLPSMMSRFDRMAEAAGTPREGDVLESIYRHMPEHDFSAEVLERVCPSLAVMDMPGVLWSDWGRPERIASTLEQVGLTPAFPVEMAA